MPKGISLATSTNPHPGRLELGLTQEKFAETFNIPVSTVRHWEQGLRERHGAASVYLQLIEHFPWEIAAMVEALRD